MIKTWPKWIIIGFTFMGILSGSKLLALYESKAPSPKIRKTIAEVREKAAIKKAERDSVAESRREIANAIIETGLKRIGIPYVYGGTSVRGFDCSGFVYHTFRQFDIHIPRSSHLLADAGKPVEKSEARRGDIVIFTGTNPAIRKPGHVGIVISKPGEPLKFVHASSNGGVKVSKVPGTRYQRRFLEVRRVL